MREKKFFLTIQALLCVLTVLLLGAAALDMYLDGAAKQAEGDLFYYMFTRERVISHLRPVMPLIFAALGWTFGGIVMGIRDENAEKPVREEWMLRSIGSVRNGSVHQEPDRKTQVLRIAVILAAVILIAAGILNGGLEDVLAKGTTVCTECVGIG